MEIGSGGELLERVSVPELCVDGGRGEDRDTLLLRLLNRAFYMAFFLGALPCVVMYMG